MDIVILAAHPDDEVLGMGGTIKKLSKNNKIHLCVISEGASAQYSNPNMIKKRKEYCKKSGKIIGISSYDFLDFPDMKLDSIPSLEINKELEKIIQKYKPKIVYTTPHNDLNKDHQIVYESSLIVTRPHSSPVKRILNYEIPGLVQTSFVPNVYIEISKQISSKIKAFKCYKSELRDFPHPRSIKSIKALAVKRGMESALKCAESFKLIKSIDEIDKISEK